MGDDLDRFVDDPASVVRPVLQNGIVTSLSQLIVELDSGRVVAYEALARGRRDVVTLDLRLVQERPGPAIAEIMNAVNAYAESTGAVVLAEGIEDGSHLTMARALGAPAVAVRVPAAGGAGARGARGVADRAEQAAGTPGDAAGGDLPRRRGVPGGPARHAVIAELAIGSPPASTRPTARIRA
jgi:hypothetical protein